jgi:hypothetical protein
MKTTSFRPWGRLMKGAKNMFSQNNSITVHYMRKMFKQKFGNFYIYTFLVSLIRTKIQSTKDAI